MESNMQYLSDEEIAKQLAAGRGFEDMINYVNKEKSKESEFEPPVLMSGEITVPGKARQYPSGGYVQDYESRLKDIVEAGDYGKNLVEYKTGTSIEDKKGTSEDINDWALGAAIMGGSTILGELFGGKRGGAIGATSGSKGIEKVIGARDIQEKERSDIEKARRSADAAQKLKIIEGQIKAAEAANDREGKKQLEEMKGKLERDLQGPMSKSEQAIKVAQIKASSQGKNAGITPYQSEMLAMRREQQGEQKAEALSKRLEKSGVLETKNVLDSIDQMIPGGLERYSGQDIPGYGQTAVVPAFALSKQGQQIRQEVSSLRNAILKMRSGGAVTPQEADRMMQELNTGITGTDQQLVYSLKRTRDKVNSILSSISGGYSQEAKKIYQEQGGVGLINNQQRSIRVPMPKVGEIRDGHTYLGGNPNDPNSWSK